ncbi:FAD-dependent oxidoreductase [Allokutzneria sp. A3M-2-11 16]|nr:FAD-dependent oxidoreductase [Allokutzneria sp. A3M-2-11 16]MCP3803340.1 FAD-dependent oxidoreductase [Allokutzneria sp. A3M-2-11 16]
MAGTETSPAFHSTMDGAVRAGERAAAEVLVPTPQEADIAALT